MASSGMAVLPSLRIGVTSTGSHLMGAYIVSASCVLGWESALGYICGGKDILHRLGDFRTNAVTLNQSDGVFSLFKNCC